jgi:PAS domain S-box-containing protein
MNSPAPASEWDESASAPGLNLKDAGSVFESFFARSIDAVWLLDQQAGVFVDCNQAAVELIGARSREQLLRTRPEDLSPPFQPDGTPSPVKTAEIIGIIEHRKAYLFEWMIRRLDGRDVPIEVSATAVLMGGRSIHVILCRDITERKEAARELVELNQSLERRVAERTAALSTSEARLRALVEHAPEAIVVFDGETGQIHFGNEHACHLYGVPMEKLGELSPADVSPEFQSNGRRSDELAREWMDVALAGGMPVFEWIHQQPDGRVIPTEVRLLRLPSEGQSLIRASIIDNTERKRAEAALRESEAKYRALFEGSSHGVALHDAVEILEINSSGVRILGCESAQELLGKHPREIAPAFQPNGEVSAVMAAKWTEECMTKGSARFEWLARAPDGRGIPLEVALTRIQWSGREVIQAFITDITQRKRAEEALHAANGELHREIEQRIRADESLKERVRVSTLIADVAVALNAGTELAPMLQRCCELMVQHLDVAFARIWSLNEPTQTLELLASAGCYTHLDGAHSRVKLGQLKIGLIAQEKKPLLTNSVQSDARVSDQEWAKREGMVAFAGYPLLIEDRVVGVLAMFARHKMDEDCLKSLGSSADSIALGMERKRAQTALAESEARFSAAFQASPIFIVIATMSDGRFVLVNDAFAKWAGFSREELLGRSSRETSVWERDEDREAFWAELRRTGTIRERECRFRNEAGSQCTMLANSAVIQLNGVPHMLAMAVDISARKQAEAELRASEAQLRESEARFSAAFQASPIFIGILRLSDGKFVLVNDALVGWLGCPRSEALGQTCAELGMWENLPDRAAVWEELNSKGRIRQRECRWRNRRGEVFTVLLSAETITLDRAPHVLLLAEDISRRKQAEVETLKALAREKELSQLKSNFVSMVSHEFRTPLGIIQSSAELLRDFHPRMEQDEREEQLDSIVRNTRRMAGMMEEVLFLSRLDAEKLEFRPTVLDLNAFCRRVIGEVLSTTNYRCSIQLSLSSIPPEAEADERLLGHIFTNLLNNAVKYSDPGGTVHFTLERDGRDAMCVIRDRGIGISESDQQQLFKAFHRGGNVGSRPGTGLGLLLVKRCAELHGGSVNVKSKISEGTSVVVNLPIFGSDP